MNHIFVGSRLLVRFLTLYFLQCFDTVGWVRETTSGSLETCQVEQMQEEKLGEWLEKGH